MCQGIDQGRGDFFHIHLLGAVMFNEFEAARADLGTVKKQIRAHPWKIVGFVLLALIVIFSKGRLFFPVMSAYIIFGIVRAVFQRMRKITSGQQKEVEKENENELSSIDI